MGALKLNVGCGKYRIEGYYNIDNDPASAADGVCEFGAVIVSVPELDEIRMDHFLEHLSFVDCVYALSLCRDALRAGGLISIEVPDLGVLMYSEIVDREQFRRALFGAQPAETHLNGFTADMLRGDLALAGFTVDSVEPFVSAHEMREGLPCLRAEAHK